MTGGPFSISDTLWDALHHGVNGRHQEADHAVGTVTGRLSERGLYLLSGLLADMAADSLNALHGPGPAGSLWAPPPAHDGQSTTLWANRFTATWANRDEVVAQALWAAAATRGREHLRECAHAVFRTTLRLALQRMAEESGKTDLAALADTDTWQRIEPPTT